MELCDAFAQSTEGVGDSVSHTEREARHCHFASMAERTPNVRASQLGADNAACSKPPTATGLPQVRVVPLLDRRVEGSGEAKDLS
jgi:hypothetical protein